MKQIRLRLEVTVEDAVTIEFVKQRLSEILDGQRTDHMPSLENGEDLAGKKLGPRVFWQTAEVKQGADRAEPPVTTKRRATTSVGKG
jgi:hypothetical protein